MARHCDGPTRCWRGYTSFRERNVRTHCQWRSTYHGDLFKGSLRLDALSTSSFKRHSPLGQRWQLIHTMSHSCETSSEELSTSMSPPSLMKLMLHSLNLPRQPKVSVLLSWLSHLRCTISDFNSGSDWINVKMKNTIMKVVCRATNRVFVESPLCEYLLLFKSSISGWIEFSQAEILNGLIWMFNSQSMFWRWALRYELHRLSFDRMSHLN